MKPKSTADIFPSLAKKSIIKPPRTASQRKAAPPKPAAQASKPRTAQASKKPAKEAAHDPIKAGYYKP